MKLRLFSFALAFFLPLLAAVPARAAADEAITDFVVTSTLSKDDVLDITEQITYDFGSSAPHDIVRSLPTSYFDDQGREFKIKFTLVDTTQNGRPLQVAVSDASSAALLTIPAGDAPHQYQLHYRLTPVVFEGDTNDIFRLSVTGPSWSVPIQHASFTLKSPGLNPQNLTCYTGTGGITSSSCVVTQPATDTVAVQTDAVMPPGASLAIYGNFPRGSFTDYLNVHGLVGAWIKLIAGAVAGLALFIGGLVWLARRPRRPRRPPAPPADPASAD